MPAHHRATHKAPPEQAGLEEGGEGVAEGVWATWKVISLGVPYDYFCDFVDDQDSA